MVGQKKRGVFLFGSVVFGLRFITRSDQVVVEQHSVDFCTHFERLSVVQNGLAILMSIDNNSLCFVASKGHLTSQGLNIIGEMMLAVLGKPSSFPMILYPLVGH